jgi:hypothetical protein
MSKGTLYSSLTDKEVFDFGTRLSQKRTPERFSFFVPSCLSG